MDQSSQATSSTDWDIRSTAQGLREDIFRALMWAIAGSCWIAQLAATVALSDEAIVQVMAVGIALVANCLFALWLLRRHSLLARSVCYLGMTAIATMTMIITQEPMLGLLCVMLPAMVGLTISPAAGLLSEGLLIVWVYIAPGLPASWADLRMVVIVGGGVSLLLGWLVQYYYAAFVRWCLMVWQQARQEAEAARSQRLGLKQTQEDLLLANRELARLADRLKLLQQLAEEARRTKEEFVANVSHELRTPLNMIIGFSEMIPKLSQVYGVELPAALLSDIAAIQRNSQHLSKLVDDVLDLSQVEAGRMMLAKEWTSLPELADEAALAVHALYESKGLYLHINVPENLPPVFCDSTRIHQVLLNLLSNAGRFTAHGGVQVQAQHDHDHVIVTVTDTGSGIAADAQEKLFEPFQQLDGSIRRTHGGTGLGLSISKRFVEMHGGRMWLESGVCGGGGDSVPFSPAH
jgi:signal transduction histidine kinase